MRRRLTAGLTPRIAAWCGVALLLATVGWIIVDTAISVIRAHHPLPYFDQWAFTADLRHWFMGTYDVTELCRQHNEHRIAVPRLLLFADSLWFGGQGVFLLASILGIQLAHAAVLMALWRPPATPRWRLLGASVVLAAMFSALQIENLARGFQVQFVLVYLAATAAMAALAQAAGTGAGAPHTGWLCCSAAAGVVANWSMANGLLVWPILLTLAWRLRLPARSVVALALVGAASAAAWLRGYQPVPDHAPPWEVLADVPHVLAYVAAFLGHPASAFGPTPCVVIGGVGLGGTAILTFLAFRNRRFTRSEQALVHAMAFVVASALVTALGRLHLRLEQALSSRYATPSFVFWACQLLLLLSLANRATRAWRSLAAAAAPLFVCMLAWGQRSNDAWCAALPLTQERVTNALLVRVRDDAAFSQTSPPPGLALLLQASVLLEHRLSVFRAPAAQWLGESLTQRFAIVAADACRGRLERAMALPHTPRGKKVRGWATRRADGVAVGRVLLVDHTGVIRGLAGGGWPRPDLAGQTAATDVGFEGYVTISPTHDDQLRAYALLPDGRSVCLLDGLVDLATVSAGLLPFEPVLGAPASSEVPVEVVVDGAWTRNGKYPTAPAPPVPFAVYGSWSGSDANVGRLQLGSFRCGEHAAVALPLLTGPMCEGLSLRLVDVEHGITIAELTTPPPQTHRWVLWQVDLPPRFASTPLAFVAEDAGTGFGQWLAVGMPFWPE